MVDSHKGENGKWFQGVWTPGKWVNGYWVADIETEAPQQLRTPALYPPTRIPVASRPYINYDLEPTICGIPDSTDFSCGIDPKQGEATLVGSNVSYSQIGKEIGELVAEKQLQYGDSFGKSGAMLKILYPEGIPVESLDDVLVIARILDKIFRIATDNDPTGESPFRDIAGYCLLAIRKNRK
jgi:hypothetical protein